VDEALNETAYGQGIVVRGKHWVHFGRNTNLSPSLKAQERLLQNQILMPVWPFFDDATTMTYNDWSNQYTNDVGFVCLFRNNSLITSTSSILQLEQSFHQIFI